MNQLEDASKGEEKLKVDDDNVVALNEKQSPFEPLIVDFSSTITGYKCPTCFENVVVIDDIAGIVKKLQEHVQAETGTTQSIEISIDGDLMTVGQEEHNERDAIKVVLRAPLNTMEPESGVLREIRLPNLPNQVVRSVVRNTPFSLPNYDALKNSKRVHTHYYFLEEEEIQVNFETNGDFNFEEFDIELPSELDIRAYLDVAHYIKIGFSGGMSAFAQRTNEFKNILAKSRARTIVVWCFDVSCATDCLGFLPNGKTWGWETHTEALQEGLHLLSNFTHIANIEDVVSRGLLERIMDHRHVAELFIEFGQMFNYERYLHEWASNLRAIVVWKINVHGRTNAKNHEKIVKRRSRTGRVERLKFYCRVEPEITEIRMFLLGVYSPHNEDYDMPNTVFTMSSKENYDPNDPYSIT